MATAALPATGRVTTVADAGLSILHDPQNAALDIVFVHGLQGHPRATWTYRAAKSRSSSPHNDSQRRRRNFFRIFSSNKSGKGKKPLVEGAGDGAGQDAGNDSPERDNSQKKDVYWPLDFLKEDLPTARIMTFGYDTTVTKGYKAAHQGNIFSHARDLLYALETKRRKTPDRGLVFLAHSLGGVLAKETLRRAEVDPDPKINKIFASTTGIFFFGTPHRGSDDWASFGEGVAGVASRILGVDKNDKVLHALLSTGPELELCRESFNTQWVKRGDSLMVRTFQETKGMTGVRWGGLNQLIVPAYSSTLDHPNQRARTVDSDHIGMVKFSARDNATYEAVRDDLEELLDQPAHAVVPSLAQSSHAQSPTYYIPFSRNNKFIGRHDALEELQKKLFIEKTCQKMAIVGLGGAGKTQVALEFAQLVKSRWPEYSIFWMPVLSAKSFEQACEEVARLLDISRARDVNEDVKELVKRRLSEQASGKWLMIVDNADGMELVIGNAETPGLADYLPVGDTGLLLFTSRRQEVAQALVGSDVVEVGKMRLDEASALLNKSLAKGTQDQYSIAELIDELDCLPLAIVQAVAYININKISVARYLELIRNTDTDLIEVMSREFQDGTRYRQAANAVATTWVVSFDQIVDDDDDAAMLLKFISHVEWKSIPRSLLPKAESEARTEDALGAICSYSFLTKHEDEEVYDMHRLVHLAIRIWFRRTGHALEDKRYAVQYMKWVFPSDDYKNRAVWRQYMPHALRLLASEDDADGRDESILCLKIGRCLHVDGRVSEAVVWLRRSHRWRQANLEETDPDLLLCQHELAKAYQRDGKIKEAIGLLEHTVTIGGQLLEEDDSNQLASLHALASVYKDDGQIQEAVKLLKHVIAVEKHHTDRLISQYTLARVYHDDGQIQQAKELLEYVVAVQEQVLAEDHPHRLASQHELARICAGDGQILEAKKLFKHVVTIRERTLAEDHPDRLTSQHELARVYAADGQIDEAVRLLERVVAIRRSKLAESHPSRIVSEVLLEELVHDQLESGGR